MLLSNGKAPSAIESKDMTGVLRDMYMLEFLDLPEPYKEYDLKKAILKNMKKFLIVFPFHLGTDKFHCRQFAF